MKQIAVELDVSWDTVRSWKRKEWFTFVDPMKGRTCEIGDCRRVHEARGMCNTHFQRWLRSGRTLTREQLAEPEIIPGGGPTVLTPRIESRVIALRRQGLKWTEIAREIGVSPVTLWKWRKKGRL